MHLNAHLDVDLVAVETEDEINVLLELTAPTPEPTGEARPPATVQVVLDRSGSMGGDRLDGARRALLALVDRLDPTDNFGLVAFDDAVQVVAPAGPLTDKPAVKAGIAALTPGGMTDLSAGYLRGLQEARRVAGPAGATVLLVSDGHANQGVTDHGQLHDVARGAQEHHIVTTTLGYGLGYDENLLGAISDGGAGEALFAEDPDTAGKLIAGQVDGLLAKSAQAAHLLVRMREPVQSAFTFGDIPCVQLPDGSAMLELGDLWAGETRKVLLRFGVPAMAALGLAQIAELTLEYVELPSLASHTLTLPIAVNVVPGDEAAGRIPNPTVQTEVAYQRAQQNRKKADEALGRGDVDEATRLLNDAKQALQDHVADAPEWLTGELAAEADRLAALAERAKLDPILAKKLNYSSWHAATRKRGRQPPPTM